MECRLSLLVLLALASAPTSLGCNLATKGTGGCKSTKCGLVGGYNQDDTTGGNIKNYYNTTNGSPGGTNFEHFIGFRPSTSYVPSCSASYGSLGDCCALCAKTPGCVTYHYFPTTGAFNVTYLKTMNTLKCPTSTSAADTSCRSFWPGDGTKNCVGFNYTGSGDPSGGPSQSGSAFSWSTGIYTDSTGTYKIPQLKSYYGGVCNSNASVINDPHFVGGHGENFDFNGQLGKSFCLITDRDIHINMFLSGYMDERIFGASATNDGKAIRSWITGLSFIWRDAEGYTRSVLMYVRKGAQQERGDGFISRIMYNGFEEPVPKAGDSLRIADFSMTLSRQTKLGPYDYDEYDVTVGGSSFAVGARVAHPLLQQPNEAYAHFNVKITDMTPTADIHGVLGQTFRTEASRTVKALEYRLLAYLMKTQIHADSESGYGLLDGGVEDYITSDLSAPDCKFSTGWVSKAVRPQ